MATHANRYENSIQKIIQLGLQIVFTSITIWFPFSCKTSTNDNPGTSEKSDNGITVLIPSDFSGTLRIVREEKCGKKIETISGKRIIEIPRNGILIIRDTLEIYYIAHEFFLVDSTGKKILIPDITDEEEPIDALTVGVKLIGPGGFAIADGSYSNMVFLELVVSNPGHTPINMDEEIFDELTRATVISCRQKTQ